ncbi:MAG: hypothetical protein CM15mP125_2660 [Gammaproteobacteria bacterium]|nr:MAG: hypothetical protein CM15mP125_2660 [Gammaproteobacteria bacterium]
MASLYRTLSVWAGWKATLDGYLEIYHHDSVHGKTVGHITVGNLLVHDTWGAHQRMAIARKILVSSTSHRRGLDDPEAYIRVVHSVFPNLSISAILGGQCLIGLFSRGNQYHNHDPAVDSERQGPSATRKPKR